MIGVWLTLEQAERVLKLTKRSARSLASVSKQIRAQLRTERLLPDNIVPEMSIRFGPSEVTQDIYSREQADAMWDALRDIDRQPARRRRHA